MNGNVNEILADELGCLSSKGFFKFYYYLGILLISTNGNLRNRLNHGSDFPPGIPLVILRYFH